MYAAARAPMYAISRAALGEAVAQSGRRTVIIAGADLSHVGQRFGEEQRRRRTSWKPSPATDRQLLALLEAREEEAFVAQLTAIGNETRICSTGCLFALLRALPERPFRVLSYHQAVDLRPRRT